MFQNIAHLWDKKKILATFEGLHVINQNSPQLKALLKPLGTIFLMKYRRFEGALNQAPIMWRDGCTAVCGRSPFGKIFGWENALELNKYIYSPTKLMSITFQNNDLKNDEQVKNFASLQYFTSRYSIIQFTLCGKN